MRQKGSLEFEFEYYEYRGDAKSVLFNIEFSYSPGTRHSHPGGHYNRSSGSWDPPDDPECEMGNVTRQTSDGKWVPVTPDDWFWDAWIIPLWNSLEAANFLDALDDRGF